MDKKPNETINTYEYNHNKGNIRKIRISYNQESFNEALKQIVLSRLKDKKIIE